MPAPLPLSLPPEASFNPVDAVPDIPGTGGLLATEQKTRPPRVFHRLVLRCACGLRLTGTEYWFFSDTLHARGVCLECGVQDLIFAPPNVNRDGGYEQRAEMCAEEMIEAISDIIHRREKAGTVFATTIPDTP